MKLEENPLLHASAVRTLRESPVDSKAPLAGSYTVLMTVGDMYTTDDLGLDKTSSCMLVCLIIIIIMILI